MTDLSQLTLAEVEALAERLGAAARTIREAQSLLQPQAPAVTMASAMATLPADYALPARQPHPPPVSMFTASELAERSRLLQQFKPDDMPADIAAAMKAP